MKAGLRGKLIALSAFINLETSLTSDLSEHLKSLDEKETHTPRKNK